MIKRVWEEQKRYYQSQSTKPIASRIEALRRLKASIKNHEDEVLEALALDLGKPAFESYATELGYVLNSLSHMIRHVAKFAKTLRVRSPIYQRGMSSYIEKVPKGTVLIIGPFNYPFQLSIEPLIGAIAAGNTVILKPSELTPHTQDILQTILSEAFAPEYVSVITGGVETTQSLLRLAFDHIFFTGSTRVGKIVMKAASDHLTPLTLELGGKSPTIVHEDAILEVAARRIAWGKFLNAGQTCVAPDYIYVHANVQDAFIKELRETIKEFYGEDPQESPDYGRIVNDHNVKRLCALLRQGQIVCGGKSDPKDRYIEPTLIKGVGWNAPVMQEEIFGPILPILTYENINQVIEVIRNKPSPLALYIFTEDKQIEKRLTQALSFGNGAINDTVSQVASLTMPFGGKGESGMGSYHGRYSFETFSHARSMVKKKTSKDSSLIYPPYRNRLKLIRYILK